MEARHGSRATPRRLIRTLTIRQEKRHGVCVIATLLAFVSAILCAHPAYADEGTITLMRQDGATASYRAYPLFFANISEDDHASHITWASPEARDAVLAYLDQTGYDTWLAQEHSTGGQHDLPQNAAEFCASKIGLLEEGAETDDENASARQADTLAARSREGHAFVNGLARAVIEGSADAYETAVAGQSFTGAQGYWLFVSDGVDGGIDTAGTEPLWVALGGSTSSLVEKAAVPTLTLEVQEDATQAWGTVADAHTLQAVNYRLVGSLPSNINSFEQYRYRIVCALGSGLALTMPDGKSLPDVIKVCINGKQVPVDGSNLSLSSDQGTLTVDFADILSPVWDPYQIDAGSEITVEYQAHATSAATSDATGAVSEAHLEYRADPVSDATAQTHPSQTRAFSYGLKVVKVDQSNKGLVGAAFTIQVAHENSDAASADAYVQKDGSLSPTPHIFETDKAGELSVDGLDEGSYLIVETKAPSGFKQLKDPIALNMTARLEGETLELKELKADTTSPVARIDQIDASARLITLCVPNEPVDPPAPSSGKSSTSSTAERLPQTGIGPVAELLTLSGAILLATQLVRMRRSRRWPRRE